MAMGTGASDNSLRGPRDRNRPRLRLPGTRKPRVQRVDLEGLETRALMATIPAASPTAAPLNISNMFGNAGGANASMTSSVVAVDPLDPDEAGVGLDRQRSVGAAPHGQRHPGRCWRRRIR